MGIQGLLPLLKSIQKPRNIAHFKGLTLAIDAYGWLHRGVLSCPLELALGKPTRRFVDYAMHRVRMLLHHGVTPYVVFDGDLLPSKAITEHERAQRRAAARRTGMDLLQMGKQTLARQELLASIDVTPEMARQLIDELRKNQIKYVVAPYEADAQMAYLEKQGLVQGVISEDSDLLVFGVQSLITKLDQYGDCIEIRRQDFSACREINLTGWSDREFRCMAILSGCDYLDNPKKLGIKTAYKYMRRYNTIEKVINKVNFDGVFILPPQYLDEFRRAELTFLHQRVYCPDTRSLVHLSRVDAESEPLIGDFLGANYDAATAIGVALGQLHPSTKQSLGTFSSAAGSSQITCGPLQVGGKENGLSIKPNTSIDAFFTPAMKRPPLAELDPNSFTPSPSQRRLLDAQHPTIISTPAPPQAYTTPTSTSTSVPSQSRLPRQGPMSETRPTPFKRPRLCAEKIDSIHDEGANLLMGSASASRYFSTSTRATETTRKSRKKAKEVEIWSDDSIDDLITSIDDPSEPEKPMPSDPLRASSDSASSLAPKTPALGLPEDMSTGRLQVAKLKPLSSAPSMSKFLLEPLKPSADRVRQQPPKPEHERSIPKPPARLAPLGRLAVGALRASHSLPNLQHSRHLWSGASIRRPLQQQKPDMKEPLRGSEDSLISRTVCEDSEDDESPPTSPPVGISLASAGLNLQRFAFQCR